jgi:hypothetical protein
MVLEAKTLRGRLYSVSTIVLTAQSSTVLAPSYGALVRDSGWQIAASLDVWAADSFIFSAHGFW